MLQIPISRMIMSDKLIWLFDSLGHFTVKSAYIVARKLLGREVEVIDYRSPLWKLV